VGNLDQEARNVVAQTAEKNKSELIEIDKPSIHYSKKSDGSATQFAKIKKQKWYFDSLTIPDIQLQNWAIVVEIIKKLDGKLNKEALELLHESWDNLEPRKVFRACLERIHPEFMWYFDGGHNQQAIGSLLNSVSRMIEIGDRDKEWPIFVIAAMQDKVNEKSFGQFAPYPNLFYYELSQPRAAKLAALKTLLPQIQPFPDQFEAQQVWLRKMQDQLVIFAGSFYFYKTVRDFTTSLAST
jgi:dihydrofolate synthase/folylpolyglutamate synthase